MLCMRDSLAGPASSAHMGRQLGFKSSVVTKPLSVLPIDREGVQATTLRRIADHQCPEGAVDDGLHLAALDSKTGVVLGGEQSAAEGAADRLTMRG